jgi:hypothetical protein
VGIARTAATAWSNWARSPATNPASGPDKSCARCLKLSNGSSPKPGAGCGEPTQVIGMADGDVIPPIGHQAEGPPEVQIDGLHTSNETTLSGRTSRAIAVRTGLEHEPVRCQHFPEDGCALGEYRHLLLGCHYPSIADRASTDAGSPGAPERQELQQRSLFCACKRRIGFHPSNNHRQGNDGAAQGLGPSCDPLKCSDFRRFWDRVAHSDGDVFQVSTTAVT